MKVYLFAYREWAFDIAYQLWWLDEDVKIDGVFTPLEYLENAKNVLEFIDDRDYNRLVQISPIATVDPRNLSSIEEFFDSTDVLLFYGWSWMVPKSFTDKFLCICLHPSPLPKYRGGSPIQNQILAGETESAVSLFKMGEGLDDGPICFQKPYSLTGNLHKILQHITSCGVEGTRQMVRGLRSGQLVFVPQDENQATFCKRRKPSDSEILPTDTAQQIYDKVRCLQHPYPNAYFVAADGKKIYLKDVDYER